MLGLFLALVAMEPAAHGPGAHPLSLSYLLVEAGSTQLRLELRPQALTLIEVPELRLDVDGDQRLSEAELAAGWPAVQDYLESGLSVALDGVAWQPCFQDYALAEEGGQPATAPGGQRLVLRATLPVRERVRSLWLRSDLFFDEGNPDHRMHVTVRGLGRAEELYLLDATRREVTFPLPAQPVLWSYLRLGWRHVLDGYDHLAFLLSLLLGVASFRSLLLAVTAFTAAHSVTLTLAALDLWALPPAVVEPGIAASVLSVLWLHLVQGAERARPWLPAFAFGLLHGFGFAGALGEIGIPTGARAVALLGFNAGVEAGQLTFVAPVAALAALTGSRLAPKRREEARLAAGSVLGGFALWLCSSTLLRHAFPEVLAGWPEPLRPAPLAVALAAGLAALLHRRRTGTGRPLAPAVGYSLLLYLLFTAGQLARTAA